MSSPDNGIVVYRSFSEDSGINRGIVWNLYQRRAAAVATKAIESCRAKTVEQTALVQESARLEAAVTAEYDARSRRYKTETKMHLDEAVRNIAMYVAGKTRTLSEEKGLDVVIGGMAEESLKTLMAVVRTINRTDYLEDDANAKDGAQ